MAAILPTSLSLLGFLTLVALGYSQPTPCDPSQVKVTQKKTGAKILGKPEWAVTFTNRCGCSVANLTVSCFGFQTTENIPDVVLSPAGQLCLVNREFAIPSDHDFIFTYAWDKAFPLTPVSVTTVCP